MTLAAPVAAAAPPSAGSRRRATRVARPRALPSRLDARTATRRGRGACPALSESFVAAAASAERDAGDASTSASAGALSIVDSTEDVFAAFCESQVELVARKHPAVADCAAFGIPSEELESENEIKLDIILRPDHAVSAEELARFINYNAPHFFVPRYIEFVSELPYTPTNKIQKYKLREKGLTENTWDARRAGFTVQR